MNTPDYANKDWLTTQYRVMGMSAARIAAKCGVGKTTILHWLRSFNIPRRAKCIKTTAGARDYQDRQWLWQKYSVERLPLVQIAQASSHRCNRKQVEYWLKKHGLWHTRTPRDYEDEDWLKHKYDIEMLSMEEISRQSEFHVDRKTIEYHMNRFGIARREHQGVGVRDYHSRDWLTRHYVAMRLSLKACAGCANPPTCAEMIRKWLRFYGIVRRRASWDAGDPKHPMRGFVHSDQTRQKIANALRGRPLSAATKKKVSAAMKGREIRWAEKISLAQKGSNAPWYGKKPPQPKTYWITCTNGQKVCMRSRWEVCFARWLDEHGYTWAYEPRTFTFAQGDAYTPDFYVKDLDAYFEVKGWMREWAKQKIARFREMYPHVQLIVADKEYLHDIECDLSVPVHGEPRPVRVCPVCGKTLPRDARNQRTCSHECAAAIRRRVAVERSAKLLSKIRRLRNKGLSSDAIASTLNKSRVRTVSGREWTGANVKSFVAACSRRSNQHGNG